MATGMEKATPPQEGWEHEMSPVRKVRGGYRWGSRGKVFKTRAAAERQGRAIKASQGRKR